MALVVVTIDTENKADSSVTVDGKKLTQVESVSLYGMGSEYCNLEIRQFEKGDSKKGGLSKMTYLSASKKTLGKIVVVDSEEDKVALSHLLTYMAGATKE